MKTGRPSLRTPQIIEEIIERISAGEPMAWICREDHMPSARTVTSWMDQDEELSAAIARAREIGGDIIAADALRIADTPVEGVRRKETEDGVEIVTEDMLGHRRLQVETRLKLLAKWHPKRYGDKLDVTSGGDSLARSEASVAEQAARLASIIEAAKKRESGE